MFCVSIAMQYLNNRTEWVTDGDVEITSIDFKDLGNSIYALNNSTIIDLIYSSYDPASKKYFFGIEEEQFYNA